MTDITSLAISNGTMLTSYGVWEALYGLGLTSNYTTNSIFPIIIIGGILIVSFIFVCYLNFKTYAFMQKLKTICKYILNILYFGVGFRITRWIIERWSIGESQGLIDFEWLKEFILNKLSWVFWTILFGVIPFIIWTKYKEKRIKFAGKEEQTITLNGVEYIRKS